MTVICEETYRPDKKPILNFLKFFHINFLNAGSGGGQTDTKGKTLGSLVLHTDHKEKTIPFKYYVLCISTF